MRTDKLLHWTLIAPLAAIGIYLALHGSTNVLAGIALGAALLAGVMAAVYHAEVVAARVGEPFGAIILALAVTVIELGLIVSIPLGDQPQPALVRDTIHAAWCWCCMASPGCIVVGAIKHREVQFRTQGAQAYLTVLIPMVVVTLVLPNFTSTTPGPFYSPWQLAFVSVVCLALYFAEIPRRCFGRRTRSDPPKAKLPPSIILL